MTGKVYSAELLVVARAFIRADDEAQARAIVDMIPNHKLTLTGPGVGGEPLKGAPEGALPLWTLSRNMVIAEICAPEGVVLELDPDNEGNVS
jgi:hypothetical protein